MELTKKQVTQIDSILKYKGVLYWDIRLEMLDHIVTDIEKRMDEGEDFEDAKNEALNQLGWNGDLKEIMRKRRRGVTLKVRNGYFREFGRLLTTPKKLIVLLMCILGLFFLCQNLNYRTAKIVCV